MAQLARVIAMPRQQTLPSSAQPVFGLYVCNGHVYTNEMLSHIEFARVH